MPGKTNRFRDISASTRLMLSTTFPVSSIKIKLEYFPMISQASVNCTTSPSVFTQEKSKYSTRSNPSCRIARSFPFPSRFRNNMQNIGGAGGLSMLCCVKCTRARSADAEIKILWLPSIFRSEMRISSLAG